MKKVLPFLFILILTSASLHAQVISDFENPLNGTQGYFDENWGTFITNVEQISDPTGNSTGVLKVTLDAKDHRPAGDPKDPISDAAFRVIEGKFLVFNLWLPATIPAGININPFMQTGDAWNFQSTSFQTNNLAKEEWVSVYIDLVAFASAGADLSKVQKVGIEFSGWSMAGGTDWQGDIYVDDVSVVGSEPNYLTQFENPAAGTQGYADENWGTFITGINQGADPAGLSSGSLVIGIDANDKRPAGDPKDAISETNLRILSGKFLAFEVWLPATIPSGISINPFLQTGDGWNFQSTSFQSNNLAKEQWVQVYIDLDKFASEGADLSKVQKIGIEISGWSMAGGTDWQGDIYLDNISVLSTETGVLPVELSTFQYQKTGNGVVLKWETTTETNNEGFDIEKSADKSNWLIIGFVSGKGTTTEKQSYSFADLNVKSQTYYRLKQLDSDGKVNYSQILSFSATPENFTLHGNYPNPFNPSTIIRFSLAEESLVTVKIFNTIGQEVNSLFNGRMEAGQKEINFDGAGLTSGNYFYTVSSGGKTITRSMTLLK